MAGRFSQERVREIIELGQIQTAQDIQSALKDLFGHTLQAMLGGETDQHLGYAKGEAQAKRTSDRRSGHSSKSMRSEYGHTLVTEAIWLCRCPRIGKRIGKVTSSL